MEGEWIYRSADTSGNHCKVGGKFRAIFSPHTVSGWAGEEVKSYYITRKGHKMRIRGGLRKYLEVAKRPQELCSPLLLNFALPSRWFVCPS